MHKGCQQALGIINLDCLRLIFIRALSIFEISLPGNVVIRTIHDIIFPLDYDQSL